LKKDQFLSAAQYTISCDRATYLGSAEACGKCTSCILRRTALISAGVDKTVDGRSVRYRTDWTNPGTPWISESAVPLMAMRDQVERLREAVEGGFAALDAAFPDLFDVVTLAPDLGFTEDELERRLLRLYQTYVREFDAFAAQIDRVGWGRRANVSRLLAASEQMAAS
jgi:hypothetical protein